jgi:hypothetical protein
MADMENFISSNLMERDVDVYCGSSEKFYGRIVGCGEGVLTLMTDPAVLTHVALDKVVAIWKRP